MSKITLTVRTTLSVGMTDYPVEVTTESLPPVQAIQSAERALALLAERTEGEAAESGE